MRLWSTSWRYSVNCNKAEIKTFFLHCISFECWRPFIIYKMQNSEYSLGPGYFFLWECVLVISIYHLKTFVRDSAADFPRGLTLVTPSIIMVTALRSLYKARTWPVGRRRVGVTPFPESGARHLDTDWQRLDGQKFVSWNFQTLSTSLILLELLYSMKRLNIHVFDVLVGIYISIIKYL